MGFGIYSTIYGANTRSIEMEVIANNIANVQTTGFKEQIIAFKTDLENAVGSSEIQKIQAPVHAEQSHNNFNQGMLSETGNPLDVAIQGPGFFEIQTPDGPRYSRAGNFSLRSDNTLINSHGYPVMTEGGAITIPSNKKVIINGQGEILSGNDVLGKLRIMEFQNRENMIIEGNNLFNANGEKPNEATSSQLLQSHLENSNVDMVRSLTRLIEVSRAYESHQKSLSRQIETATMLNKIVNFN